MLNSLDTDIQANISLNGLSNTSSINDWRMVAESDTPIAWFNFTRYQSTTVLHAAVQLQDNLKNIGIRLQTITRTE